MGTPLVDDVDSIGEMLVVKGRAYVKNTAQAGLFAFLKPIRRGGCGYGWQNRYAGGKGPSFMPDLE